MFYKLKKLPKFYRYTIYFIFFILLLSLIFLLIIYHFPIKTTSTNLSTARFSKFVSPWPISALDKEYQERKRLRRYAKAEQKKRLEKQLQRMNILNIPIYDLALDEEAEVIVGNSKYYPNKTDYLWPILPKNKQYSNNVEPSLRRKSVQVLMPNQNWTSIYEGVYLAAGDEIKANIPIIKDKRYLNFSVFPLTPGNIRVILGQYVWAKTFGEEDVQKIQKVNIPINDPTATNIRALSISCSCYFLDVSINQILRNGREPIKVAINSSLWLPNKNFLVKSMKEDNTTDDDVTDDSLQTNVDETKGSDEPSDLKPEESKQLPPEPVVAKPTMENIDPLLQTSNNQILVNNEKTTAFGYNIVVVQTPPVDSTLFKNKSLLKKIAPAISGLLENSVYFENNISTLDKSFDIFRQTIFQNYDSIYDDNQTLFQYKIEQNEADNIYQKFRRYGYKVVSIAPAESLFFSSNIANDATFAKYYNRWLSAKDWEFENRNMKIDDKSGASSGLDAIFNLDNTKKIKPPLNNLDYLSISNYLSEVALNVNKVPNWQPNQYILISNKNFYAAKVADAFQNWTESNISSRFFAHILLDGNHGFERPSFYSLKKSFLSMGPFSLAKPTHLKNIAELSSLDISVADILMTIKARRTENRTLVFILIPDSNGLPASGIYKIPGLIGKKISAKKIPLNNIFATVYSNVGIPTSSNELNPALSIEKNHSQFENVITTTPPKEEKYRFLKYTLLLKPNKNLCSPIIWKSQQSKLLGLKANYPIYRILDADTLQIYPCSIPDRLVEFTWYQNKALSSNSQEFDQEETSEKAPSSLNEIGGRFYYFKNQKSFPEVYLGKNLISYENIIFMFKSLNPKDVENIFYVDESELNNTVKAAKQSFYGFDEISSEKNSKLALFITPL